METAVIEREDNVVELKPASYERKPLEIQSEVAVELPNACLKYPELKKMQVNDSIFVSGEKTSKQVAGCARRYAKRAGWTIVARKEKTGLRIWRTK
jgi:hypothetical protein